MLQFFIHFNGIRRIAKREEVLNSAAQKMKSGRVLNHTEVPQVATDEARLIKI
ncbi:MAG: hypothetical protein ACK5NT_03905 [Pyrinomonadaceae bacterium]